MVGKVQMMGQQPLIYSFMIHDTKILAKHIGICMVQLRSSCGCGTSRLCIYDGHAHTHDAEGKSLIGAMSGHENWVLCEAMTPLIVADSVPFFQLSTPCSPHPFRLMFTISKITHTLHTHCLIRIFIRILLTYPIHLTTFPLSNFSYPLSSNSFHHTHILFPSCKYPHHPSDSPSSYLYHFPPAWKFFTWSPSSHYFSSLRTSSPIPLTLCLHPSTPT